VTVVLGILAGVSFGLFAWQFYLGARIRLLTSAATKAGFPAISILKPLKGCDSETEGCLRSWLEQDYPGPVQMLFGVAAEDDSAVELARQKLKADVVVCPQALGANAKVSTLAQLEPLIQHELVIISDADVAVPKDFLRRIAGFFASERPALASCLYRLSGAVNLPMRLEAFIMNSDFWSQVLQSLALKPMNFALGAAMAITRAELAKLGGFRALVDYLADDFQLGNRVSGKVALCPIIVECRSAPMTWTEVCAHQLRWARTIRVCQPLPFFFSIVSNSTYWLLAWGLASNAWIAVSVMLVLRCLGGAWLERKFTGQFHAGSLILAPLSDLLRAVFWLFAFASNRIYWRGRYFRVMRGGKLTPENTGG
jgi:ceramide glucosyltransferase